MRALVALFLVACSEAPAPPDGGAIFEDATAELDATVADASVPDAELPDADTPDTSDPPLDPVSIDLAAAPPEQLSAFRFFRLRNGAIEYNQNVHPYELNTALFSDYAAKARAIYVPPGTQIRYRENEPFDFPIGSAIIKSFIFNRIVETRLLIRHTDGWRPYPYLWREDGSDADYFVRGRTLQIELTDPFGDTRTAQYLVPQRNQCFECHEAEDGSGEKITVLIGPKSRHLHRDGQLERFAALGILEGLPADTSTIARAFELDTLYTTGTTALDAITIERAARDYLDINCAHCHNPRATQGVTSQLFLNWDNTDLFRLGVCKEPGSAGSGAGGLRFDIVPGAPGSSILWYRMQSETVGELMPLIGRSLRDELAVDVVAGWIANMAPDDCE